MSSSPNSSSSSSGPRQDAAHQGSSAEHSPAKVFQHLLDVRVPVNVLLGSGTISIRQCLALERNSLVELEQSAGEDLHLDVNGVRVARGEVVIMEDSAALRITEISAPPPPKAIE
jgi:flagellar motor switch protein FliN